MKGRNYGLFFDSRDHSFLRMVNDVMGRQDDRDDSQRRFYPHLHPRGIKELAESRGLRIGYAVANLLGSLEAGRRDERLAALRSLRDEVLNATDGSIPKNTARVLLQIMKELVRAWGDYERQLKLAHDFRRAAAGKPQYIRRQLKKYHLLELPESWNHLAFDDHVHDVNTKGRKSATHLIMDAWIKGIRRLRVIYYNYIESHFAIELLEAAEIMGLDVRIGIEFSACFRNRYVQVIWVPRGFQDSKDFILFLNQESVRRFMAEGRAVSEYQQRHVLDMLDKFNLTHREHLNRELELNLEVLNRDDFIEFVKPGQASLLHLAKFVHTRLLPHLRQKTQLLQTELSKADTPNRAVLEEQLQRLDDLDAEVLYQEYLSTSRNPDLPDPEVARDGPEVPEILNIYPCELMQRLAHLRSGYRITLNLSNLWAEDVLELLYDCQGMITRLEIFNLKDYTEHKTDQIHEINELQTAINEGNLIKLKRVIRGVIDRVSQSNAPDRDSRIEKLDAILHDINSLKSRYKTIRLKSRLGSDSTGQSSRMYGMGLAVVESLPYRSRKRIDNPLSKRILIPFYMDVQLRSTYVPREGGAWFKRIVRMVGTLSMVRPIFFKRRDEWIALEHTTRMVPKGNIVTLGGMQEEKGNGLLADKGGDKNQKQKLPLSYLNTRLKLFLKIAAGFAPAFATFALTYDWPLLKYGGALIWFFITGLRNIVQSVLGGGGLRRSPLLRWNDYISWERISDSLLFTGFSVPLLDLLVKNLLLDQTFGVTVHTNPILLYSIIALANGIYLFTHNMLRGLPRGAAIGNVFRSVVSIPIAILFNAALGSVLELAGVAAVDMVLQKWAAVISKTASDMAAGIIEGSADRFHNIRLRTNEYQDKLDKLMEAYSNLEMCFPEARVLEILKSMERSEAPQPAECRDLEQLITVHSLDLLYFWMYQPRARTAFSELVKTLSDEELRVLMGCQHILKRQREISQLFIDGMIGRNFSKGLSFYLDHTEEYLAAQQKILGRREAEIMAG